MSIRPNFLPLVFCFLTLMSTHSLAQNVARPQATGAAGAEQTASSPPNANSLEAVGNQIDLLRKSVQTLNTRLREISEKLPAPTSTQNTGGTDKNRITSNLDLLGRAEDRAGVLRKQLIELIEKETTYRSRLALLDEDVRPENVERALSGVGTTRTVELREVRRRSLEIEKRGLESLVVVIGQSRARLEEDLRQADSLCSKLRQRLFPLIEKEVDKISP